MPSADRTLWVVAALTGAVLAGVAIVVLPLAPMLVIGGAIVGGVGILALDRAVGRHQIDFLAPRLGFPLVYSVFFGFGSLSLLPPPPAGYDWAVFLRPVDVIVPVLAAVGLIAFVAGTWAADRMPVRGAAAIAQHSLDPTRLALIAAVAAGVGTAAAGYALWRSGVPLLSGSAATARLDLASDNGIANTVYQTLFVVGAGLAAVAAVLPGPRQLLRLVLLSAIVVATVVTGLLLGVRGLIFETGLLALPAWHLARRAPLPLFVWILVAAICTAFIGLFGWWRDSQYLGGEGAFARQYTALGFPEASLGFVQAYTYWRGTVVAFGEIVSSVPQHVAYQHGQVLLAGLGAVMPGHQEAADIFIKHLLGLEFSAGAGVPGSLLSAFYADFGVFGICAGMFALGFSMQWIYRKYRSSGGGGWSLATAYMTKVAMFSLFATGPAPYLTSYITPIILWVAYSAGREPLARSGRIPTWAYVAAGLLIAGPVLIAVKYTA